MDIKKYSCSWCGEDSESYASDNEDTYCENCGGGLTTTDYDYDEDEDEDDDD